MDSSLIIMHLKQRNNTISSVSIANFETPGNAIFCIPENRSKVRSIAFIPKFFLDLEKNELINALKKSRIHYERA